MVPTNETVGIVVLCSFSNIEYSYTEVLLYAGRKRQKCTLRALTITTAGAVHRANTYLYICTYNTITVNSGSRLQLHTLSVGGYGSVTAALSRPVCCYFKPPPLPSCAQSSYPNTHRWYRNRWIISRPGYAISHIYDIRQNLSIRRWLPSHIYRAFFCGLQKSPCYYAPSTRCKNKTKGNKGLTNTGPKMNKNLLPNLAFLVGL